MSELSGTLVRIRVGGSSVTTTDEATLTTDNKTYTITNESKRIMDYASPIVIKNNGIDTAEKYKIDKPNGIISFDTVDDTRVITADYKYIPTTVFASAYSYTANRSATLAEVTRFIDEYKRRMTISKDIEGEISSWDVVDTYFLDALEAGKPVYLQIENEPGFYKTYAVMIESNQFESAVDNPQNVKIAYKGTII